MRGNRLRITAATSDAAPTRLPASGPAKAHYGDCALDRRTETNYAHFLTQLQPTHPAANPPSVPAAAPSAQPPVMSLVDAGILTVRDKLASSYSEVPSHRSKGARI